LNVVRHGKKNRRPVPSEAGLAENYTRTDDGQAEICEQQFARNTIGRQDGEAGGADVPRLFRLNQSRQAAYGAHGGGDDVAGLDNPRRAAGRFLAGDDVAGGRAVRREVTNLDVVKRLAGLRRDFVRAAE
jgi:hypothetical protein